MLNLYSKLSMTIAWSATLRTIARAALFTAAIATSQAHASTITYDFTVKVTKGSHFRQIVQWHF